jgi:hypothetical protein
MSRAEGVFESPVAGVRVVARIGTEESEGDMLVADLYVRPGGAVAGEHVHTRIEEWFTVMGGLARCSVSGRSFPTRSAPRGPDSWPRSASEWADLRRTPRQRFSRSTSCRSRTGGSLCPIPACHRASGGAKARYASRDTSRIVSLAAPSGAPSEKTTT